MVRAPSGAPTGPRGDGAGGVSALWTLAATATSLGAIGCLAATDPKRRRAFRLPAAQRGHRGATWAAVLAPGAMLSLLGGAGGVFIWFGATSVAGWALASTSPTRLAGLRQRLGVATAAAFGGLADAAARPLAQRVGELEGRVRALEYEVAILRNGSH